MATVPTRDLVRQVVPVIDMEIRQRAQGFEERGLVSLFTRRKSHFCCEIFGRDQGLVRYQKMLGDLLEI